MSKKGLGILISGRGSNMEAIIQAALSKQIDATVNVVISNKKNALGIAKKATKAIPISTNSIVPVTGEFKNLRPNTSQKVSIDKNKSIKPEAIAE